MLCSEGKFKGFALEGKTEDEMLAEAVPFYKDLFSKRVTTPSALSRIGSFIKHTGLVKIIGTIFHKTRMP